MRCIIFLLCMLLGWTSAARLLGFFPFPAKSHHNMIRPILIELAKRGHEVTYVTPIPAKNPPKNFKQIIVEDHLAALQRQVDLNELGKLNAALVSHIMSMMGFGLGENLYSSKVIQDVIHSTETYDAVLMESLFVQEQASALMHKFNAIGIDIHTLGECAWVNELTGLPDNPAYMIDFKSPYTDKMTYYERFHNTYITYVLTMVSYLHLIRYQWQVDKYFNYTGWESRPPIRQMMSDKALVLINSHHSSGYSYPKAPHVKEVGGINVLPNKPLPSDLQDFMDGATDGVIYFSFGSNLKSSDIIKSGKLESFVKVFSKVKQRVIWKWESDELPQVSKNVKLGKWLPQQDILAHKNIKLFITHGGVLSIYEAINHGVPLICVPFFGDQAKNANQIHSTGYGVKLTFDNITETSMTWAINEILTKPSYKAEAKRRSLLFKDRPHSPMDEAIYWIEYVLKHKNVLQPQSVHLSFIQLHNLDILFPIFLILLIMLVVSYKITKLVLCCILKKRKQPVDITKKNK